MDPGAGGRGSGDWPGSTLKECVRGRGVCRAAGRRLLEQWWVGEALSAPDDREPRASPQVCAKVTAITVWALLPHHPYPHVEGGTSGPRFTQEAQRRWVTCPRPPSLVRAVRTEPSSMGEWWLPRVGLKALFSPLARCSASQRPWPGMGAGGGRPCHVFPKSTLGEHAAQGGGIGTMKTGTNQSHFPIPRGAGCPTFTNAVHRLLRGHRGGTEAVHSQTNILSWTNGPKASRSLGGCYSSVLQLGHLLPIRDHQGTGGL